MANNIKFIDNSNEINEALEQQAKIWLEEASGEIEAQAKRNSRVDSGQLKGSWTHTVNEEKLEAEIGSPLENAIWEEYGTGEFAVNNNGRKTPWKYKDGKGNWHITSGKKPNKTLGRAFDSLKTKLNKRLAELLKGVGK